MFFEDSCPFVQNLLMLYETQKEKRKERKKKAGPPAVMAVVNYTAN